jgi:hypothetical protein
MHEKSWVYQYLLIGCCCLALAAALAACGGQSSSSSDGAASIFPTDNGANARLCRQQTAGLARSLQILRGRLTHEPRYRQYIHEVQHVLAVYRQTPFEQAEVACLTGSASLAESVVNDYVGAANVWTRCIAAPGCDPESVHALVAKRWWIAGLGVARLSRGFPTRTKAYMAGLRIPPPTSGRPE